MRVFTSLFSILSMIVLFCGCEEENIDYHLETEDNLSTYSGNYLFEDSELRKEYKDYVLVGGDAMIHRSLVDDQGLRKQNALSNTSDIVLHKFWPVKYYIDPSFTTAERSSIQAGANQWNSVPGAYNFERVYSLGESDIYIERRDTFPYPGFGEFPFGGIPGSKVMIGINYFGAGGIYDNDDLEVIAAHEMGHNVGLDHSDLDADAYGHLTHFHGTPENDPNSVMTPVSDPSTNHVNEYDERILQMIYPDSYESVDNINISVNSNGTIDATITMKDNAPYYYVDVTIRDVTNGFGGPVYTFTDILSDEESNVFGPYPSGNYFITAKPKSYSRETSYDGINHSIGFTIP